MGKQAMPQWVSALLITKDAYSPPHHPQSTTTASPTHLLSSPVVTNQWTVESSGIETKDVMTCWMMMVLHLQARESVVMIKFEVLISSIKP
ncbi:hypothetical protein L1987_37132 [Smallanthus sonchifolius]|uniref:Uncharacterized protein n=1 Tax=Smallanthus sonchifolius TaxID=185202 RepID=A0ACB9HGV4_9ASTR|nr:hypothetical protein L1987_37132 [Smallanthus sonchifolius]